MTSSNVDVVRVVMFSDMVPSLGRSSFDGLSMVTRLTTPATPDAFPAAEAWMGDGSVTAGQPALGVDGGHAARSGGGDCLAVGVILNVAAGEDTLDVGAR
jgi:hypothetical protein